MRRYILLLFTFLATFGGAEAQIDVRQKLQDLFDRAESSYLIDDYQQLDQYIDTFRTIFTSHAAQLEDSLDVYKAYYSKMRGSYHYGWAEIPYYAQQAESYYRASIRFIRRLQETNELWSLHKHEVTLHEELAQLFYKTRDYERARSQLDTVYTFYDYKNDISSYDASRYRTLSQLAICNARLGRFNEALSQIDEALKYYKKHREEGYYEAQRKKGKILMLQADSEGNGNYVQAVKCYQQYVNEQYTAIGQELAKMDASQRAQYWLNTHQFLYDCFRLGNQAPEMLYNLALFSKGYLIAYEKDKNIPKTDWKQVRKQLNSNDCAIEFVQYFGRDDEQRMGCLVLRHNSSRPQFIDLFATDSLLDLPLTRTQTVGSAMADERPAMKDTLYNDKRLAHLMWTTQLMDAIGNADKVFFAADGMLHQWAIEYLMPDAQKVCYRLSSTRNIQKKRKPIKLERALICGGITYGEDITPTERNNDIVAYRFLSSSVPHIGELPDAQKEVDSIYTVRANPLDTLLTGKEATDENFIRLVNSNYDLIHISTHGFFGGRIGIYNDIKPLYNDNSMSRSGLIFAGASSTLSDKDFDEDLFDGILSAEELSRLNLSQTKLVVLSACETGLGHLTADGVYGVQRALKIAGAQAMIVSLWRVNDTSCSMLMRYFYEALQQPSADIHSAFLYARERLMKEERPYFRFDVPTFSIVKDTIRYDTPRHTNPFILIDAF